MRARRGCEIYITERIVAFIYSGPAEKKLNKIFSYNSGCLTVIIRLLFNPPDAL